MLRLMLGHHPRFSRCGEMEYLTEVLSRRGALETADLAQETLEANRVFRSDRLHFNTDIPVRTALTDLVAQIGARDDATVIGATVHNGFEHLADLWPDARFIFLHRDPRDVARSSVRMGWAGNAWAGSEIWLRAQRSLQKLRTRIQPEQLIELRFEELVAEPEAELSRICKHLDESFDPSMLAIDEDTTYARPSASLAKSWRDDATDVEIAQIEAAIGPQRIREAGYQLSQVAPMSMNAVIRAQLSVENRLGRFRFRLNRYGTLLTLRSAIAKRSGIASWRRSTQRSIDEVDIRHLK